MRIEKREAIGSDLEFCDDNHFTAAGFGLQFDDITVLCNDPHFAGHQGHLEEQEHWEDNALQFDKTSLQWFSIPPI